MEYCRQLIRVEEEKRQRVVRDFRNSKYQCDANGNVVTETKATETANDKAYNWRKRQRIRDFSFSTSLSLISSTSCSSFSLFSKSNNGESKRNNNGATEDEVVASSTGEETSTGKESRVTVNFILKERFDNLAPKNVIKAETVDGKKNIVRNCLPLLPPFPKDLLLGTVGQSVLSIILVCWVLWTSPSFLSSTQCTMTTSLAIPSLTTPEAVVSSTRTTCHFFDPSSCLDHDNNNMPYNKNVNTTRMSRSTTTSTQYFSSRIDMRYMTRRNRQNHEEDIPNRTSDRIGKNGKKKNKMSVYVKGGGFSGFWFIFGRVQAFVQKHQQDQQQRRRELFRKYSSPETNVDTQNEAEMEDDVEVEYFCFSAGCLAVVAVVVGNLTIDEMYQLAYDAREQWDEGHIHRYEFLPYFANHFVSYIQQEQQQPGGEQANGWESVLPKIHVITTTNHRHRNIQKSSRTDEPSINHAKNQTWSGSSSSASIPFESPLLTSSSLSSSMMISVTNIFSWWFCQFFVEPFFTSSTQCPGQGNQDSHADDKNDHSTFLFGGGVAAAVRQVQSFSHLKHLLIQATWIPFVTGSTLWHFSPTEYSSQLQSSSFSSWVPTATPGNTESTSSQHQHHLTRAKTRGNNLSSLLLGNANNDAMDMNDQEVFSENMDHPLDHDQPRFPSDNYHTRHMDGFFSQRHHPLCDHTIDVAKRPELILNSLNAHLTKEQVYSFYQMGLNYDSDKLDTAPSPAV